MILVEQLLKTTLRQPCRLIIARSVSSLLETKTTEVKANGEKWKPIIEANEEKDSYDKFKAAERLKAEEDKYKSSKELLQTSNFNETEEPSALPERYINETSNDEKNYEIVDFQSIEDKIDRYEKRSVLQQCKEDISHVAPYLKPTFNFAAYVNKSETLQELLKLGVDLWKVEKKIGAPEYVMGLDFERDIKKHVIFLYEAGLSVENIGKFITKNPFIFREDLDDLQVRINYLEAKRFTADMIARIIGHNPFWLTFTTKKIDERLGFFQKEFQLTGNEVRQLAVTQPRLITFPIKFVKTNMFVLKEEMSFTDDERKELLLNKPNLFMKDQNKMLDTFQYIHRDMNIETDAIVKQPGVLTCRVFRMKQRHLFLKRLGKIQFDPKKPGYISILSIAEGNDLEFCIKVAKVPIETYNLFLKTL